MLLSKRGLPGHSVASYYSRAMTATFYGFFKKPLSNNALSHKRVKFSQSASVHALPYMEGVNYTRSSFPRECGSTSSVPEELIFLILRVFSSFLRFVGVVQGWKAV